MQLPSEAQMDEYYKEEEAKKVRKESGYYGWAVFWMIVAIVSLWIASVMYRHNRIWMVDHGYAYYHPLTGDLVKEQLVEMEVDDFYPGGERVKPGLSIKQIREELRLRQQESSDWVEIEGDQLL